ncbi:MAG: hypothetical protein GY870_01635, partial [archaeon]|nr:hypothetical protein [archaeon]
MILNLLGDKISPAIEIYTIKGAKIYSKPSNKIFSRTIYSISLEKITQNISSSVLIINIKTGNHIFKFRVVKTHNNTFLMSTTDKTIYCNNPFSITSFNQPLEQDTLQFIRNVPVESVMQNIKEYSIPITDFSDNIRVTLDLIPYEVINIALDDYNAGRRYPTEIGTTLKKHPYDLKRYLQKVDIGPHDYEAWCSEFLSWCYRATGYGFDGNSWMLDAHTTIESWFRRKNA